MALLFKPRLSSFLVWFCSFFTNIHCSTVFNCTNTKGTNNTGRPCVGCFEGRCLNKSKQCSQLSLLNSFYSGAFKSNEEVARELETHYPRWISQGPSVIHVINETVILNRKKRLAAPPPMMSTCMDHEFSDNGIGCSTCLTLVWYDALNNLSGERRYVVHIPEHGLYQWVTHGRCLSSTPSGTGCSACQIQTAFRIMLVSRVPRDEPGWSPFFDTFEIQNHCKCSST